MRTGFLLLLLLPFVPLALSCGGDDDTGPVEGDTDADADADSDTDADGDSDIVGLLAQHGTATVDGHGYQGQEAVLFIADQGMGEELCRIEYEVSGTGVREDCEDCVWAFDLQAGAPTVVIEDRCADVGWDASAVAAIEGSWICYGFAREYIGHADALLVFESDGWGPVAYASWDEPTGAFNYEWDRGYVPVSAVR